MTDLDPRKAAGLTPGSRPGTLAGVSRPVLIGAGIILGSAALIAVGAVLVALLHVVVTLVSLVALGAVLVAFWIFWPAYVYALNIGKIRVEDVITRGNPLEALKTERDNFAGQIQAAVVQLAAANGELANMQQSLEQNRPSLSAERITTWEDKITRGRAAYAEAQKRVGEMKTRLDSFDLDIRSARAEMSMASADQKLGAALSATRGAPEFSHKSQVALEEISRNIGKSSAMLDLAMQDVGT